MSVVFRFVVDSVHGHPIICASFESSSRYDNKRDTTLRYVQPELLSMLAATQGRTRVDVSASI